MVAGLDSTSFNLSNEELEYIVGGSEGFGLSRYGLRGHDPWAGGGGMPSAVHANERRIDVGAGEAGRIGVSTTILPDGSHHATIRLRSDADRLEIDDHTVLYADTDLIERWQTVRNVGTTAIRIDRVDTICLSIPPADYEIMYFRSGWGREYEGTRQPLRQVTALECRAGRSSQGASPWFALIRPDGQILAASVMWSGNWVFRFEPGPEGGVTFSGGLHDWEFSKNLAPGEVMEAPHVSIALGTDGDLNTVSAQYARVGRRHWYPRAPLASSMPVEWNHWWSYEDRAVNEVVFLRNAEAAADMGIEVCTLDAGWFGPSGLAVDWYAYRGDWDTVNTARFPGGIRLLSDHVHELGMKFGLWCEIEGLGECSRLAQTHAEFAATRDGAALGYVCFGSRAARDWAYSTLHQLVEDYEVDWIKIDFNLDPGAGCTRTDHGHGSGDGLFEHYVGLYDTLQRVRQRHPEVVLENCSSGGLRSDLGMQRQTHLSFLSDPDWPEHSLRVFWGALSFLSPDVLLHWSFSPSLQSGSREPFDPWNPKLTQRQLDFYLRIAMLHACGFSQKLWELPDWVRARFTTHIKLYKDQIRRFINSAELRRLTEQLACGGHDDRWAAFQYTMPENDEHLVFAFVLQGAELGQSLRLAGLESQQMYLLNWLGSERAMQRSGEELMHLGLPLQDLAHDDSAIILIQNMAPDSALTRV